MPVTAGGETNMSNKNYGNLVRPPTTAYVPPPPTVNQRVSNNSLNNKPSQANYSPPTGYVAPTPSVLPVSPITDAGYGGAMSYEQTLSAYPELSQSNNILQQAAMNKLVSMDAADSYGFQQQADNERARANAALGDRGYGSSAEFANRAQGPAYLSNPEAESGIAPDITNPAIPDPIPPRPTNRSQVVNGTAPAVIGPSVDQGGLGAGIGAGIGAAGAQGRGFAMSPADLRRSAAARLGL